MNHKADYSEFFRWPLQKPEYLQALIKAYESGDWGRYHGQNCQTLVEVISRYFERSFVRLCSSGTIAVEIALKAAGVKVGDEVILSAYDFPGN
ncbi:DegT/DnrJ/EryC1/StrS family aminotransferase, partial [Mariniblastus sp.]